MVLTDNLRYIPKVKVLDEKHPLKHAKQILKKSGTSAKYAINHKNVALKTKNNAYSQRMMTSMITQGMYLKYFVNMRWKVYESQV